MKSQKFLSIIIFSFSAIWFFGYFLSYINGGVTFFPMLLGLVLWFCLLGIAVVQTIRLISEKDKQYKRIYCILVIPLGIVDWEKLEGANYLVDERNGTVGCKAFLKLRKIKDLNIPMHVLAKMSCVEITS